MKLLTCFGVAMLAASTLVAGTPVSGNSSLNLTPQSFGGGAMANIGFWNEKNNWAGNPNTLNRRDRVVFQFDLRRLLVSGKINRAVLVLPLQPFGKSADNRLELQVFRTEHAPVRAMDIISEEVAPLQEVALTSVANTPLRFDVTREVNGALARGDGSITFRLRNITIEKKGNRNSQPEGAEVDRNRLQLEIRL